MKIKIKVGSKDKPEISSIELNARKTLDGKIIIKDHSEIDILISPEQMLLVLFPKNEYNDVIYQTQNRFFEFMTQKGIIDPGSMKGSNVLGSFEAKILPSEKYDEISLTLINISKWIDEEKPYSDYLEKYEEMFSDYLLKPDRENSTELGEIPHEDVKGSIRPGYMNKPYWQSYMLEEEKK